MIKLRKKKLESKLQDVIGSMPGVFNDANLLRNNVVKLSVDHNIKPVAEPSKRVAYHLKSWTDEVISGFMAQDITEEHLKDEHVLCYQILSSHLKIMTTLE